MRIQVKIVLLLGVFAIVFLSVALYFRGVEKERLDALLAVEQKEKESVFDKISALRRKSLESFAYDYTYWDEMVDFVKSGDMVWAEQNIVEAMTTYKAQLVWIYDASPSLVYSASSVKGFEEPNEIPLPKEAIAELMAQRRLCHLFFDTPRGLLEVYGASIHPTADRYRETAAQGYFFAGHFWDQEFIGELVELTGVEGVKLVRGEAGRTGGETHLSRGTFRFFRELSGWQGIPVARVEVFVRSSLLEKFDSLTRKFYFLFIAFMLLVLLMLSIVLMRWINVPLRRISEALKKDDCGYIDALEKDRTEFGDFARLIRNFFSQREELKRAYEQLKTTQAQLTQSAKMASIGQLAGGVAHEINNPLTGVLNNAQMIKMLSRQNKELGEFRELVDDIEESAQRCVKITRALLDFSRSSGKVSRDLELNGLIDKVTELVSQELKLQGIRLEKNLARNLPRIKGDSQLLQQVIFDLIVNARWAVAKKGPGGTITVETGYSPYDGKVTLSVSDTGIGIPAENIDKIFEPFFTTKEVGEGTGLGLSIVYHIVKTHGGDIRVESVPGEGTAFRVTLPAA